VEAFSSDLRARLSASPFGETKTLEQDLQKQIAAFTANLSSLPSLRFQDIDNEATVLWNLCTRLRRGHDAETPQFPHMAILMGRVFAFMLLDCARGKGKFANLIRVMKVGLKTAKSCIGMCHSGIRLTENDSHILVSVETSGFCLEGLGEGCWL
jgi:hypothetical protein